MEYIIYVFKATVVLFLSAVELAMLARVILSWFFMGEEKGIMAFLVNVTEPVIYPVRAICDHFGWFGEIPIDVPFMIAYLIIAILQSVLVF